MLGVRKTISRSAAESLPVLSCFLSLGARPPRTDPVNELVLLHHPVSATTLTRTAFHAAHSLSSVRALRGVSIHATDSKSTTCDGS